ncbi:MAG: type II toxin-antitoxin system Phd/YefM family antitoxin [Spirochaetales bacterium]|nr:type II toxin-antitoxin system Phd/YefM family antitoxin [Spirochaetales bacterium]
MIVDTITQAKTQLSSLIEKVLTGEEVLIKRAGKPVAILKKYSPTALNRYPGALKNKIKIAKDFDELPPDMAESFGMKKK